MQAYETEVCVVGAGPSGLATAIGLALMKVPFVLVDADHGPVAESRALAIHSGGTEVLAELGVADDLVAKGLKVRTFQIYTGRRPVTTIPWDSAPSPYPFLLFVPQHTTETLLVERLAQLGAEPLFNHAVTRVEEVQVGGYQVTGDGFTIRARYVVGADGLSSTVRRELGITLPTHTYSEAFLLGDVTIDGDFHPEQAHVFPSRHGLLFFGPTASGVWRLIITVRASERPPVPTLDVMQRHVDQRGPGTITIKDMTWAAAFQVYHGVVERYGQDGGVVIGDAAHAHSPTGGQGLNTGIQDGYDLAATLASIHRGADPVTALAGFRYRRHQAAREVLRITHRVHRILTADTLPIHLLRAAGFAALERLPWARRRLVHGVSSVTRTPQATGAPPLRA